MEKQFGISCYVSDGPGFSAVLKQRYQDFIVHEIDQSGNVVVLSDLKHVDSRKSCTIAPQRKPVESVDFDVIPSSTVDELYKLENQELDEVNIDCAQFDKAQRTKVHNIIREKFTNLDSKTIMLDQRSVIQVSRQRGNDNDKRTRKRSFWPSDRNGDFCKFVLYKENKDSGNALAVVGRFLHIKQIAVAGTKDRRAVTSQLATVYRVEAETLAKLNDRLMGIRLGNFSYCENQLHLGALRGNRFTIVLRNVDVSPVNVTRRVEELKRNGFINYYGLQRFGSSSIATHEIGKAILQKNWSKAVDLVLSPRDNGFAYMEKCYDVWTNTKDASQAFAAIAGAQRDTSIEGCLLKALKKGAPNDFASAFRAIPRNTRNLYVHSFQSFIWNKLASKRLSTFDDKKLLVGDLILKNTENPLDENSETKYANEADLELENLDKLVLPFVSSPDCLPKNETAKWYDEILEEENVTWAQLKDCSKEYALHGGIRRLLLKPYQLTYDLIRYNDPIEPLSLTDLDIINGKLELPANQDGKYLALKLEFSLPPGSYATMVLRELTKLDSSKHFQSTLNVYSTKARTETAEDKDEEANDSDNGDIFVEENESQISE